MANLSDYTEGLIATWLAGGAAPSQLTTVYLELYSTPCTDSTAGTSVQQTLTGSASRIAIPVSANFAAASNNGVNTVKNSSQISITNSAGACNLSSFAIWNQSTGGNMLYHGSLLVNNAVVAIGAGDTVRFDVNSITLTVD